MPPFCEEHAMFHRYYGEHGDMRRAAIAAEKDAERRDRAERIARQALDQFGYDSWDEDDEIAFLLRLVTAAALQALTEKENAR